MSSPSRPSLSSVLWSIGLTPVCNNTFRMVEPSFLPSAKAQERLAQRSLASFAPSAVDWTDEEIEEMRHEKALHRCDRH